MKELDLHIEYDDTDGYKGHGEDVGMLIQELLQREMIFTLEADGVIKKGWTIIKIT